MRIRFLSDQIYETGGPGKGPRFAKGDVLDASAVGAALGLADDPTPEWSEGFLTRWIQRGVAVHDDADQAPVIEPTMVSDPAPVNDPDIYTLTRSELDALAAKRGVDIDDARNKGDVIAALELHADLGNYRD